ncbi:MAG TPA: TetR/AcrR family transcriptional regulator [Pseudoduganella sp.]
MEPGTEMTERQQRTRDRLLDAATAEFLDRGYAGATLAGVAARGGVSTATLHKYFATKRAMFAGMLERFWASNIEPPELGGDPAACLRCIGSAYAERLLPPESPAVVRVVIAEAIHSPELGQELYERGKGPYMARLASLLADAVADGRMKVPDIPLAVGQFFGMINDVLFWPRLLCAEATVSRDDAERVVNEAVATFLARYAVAEK